MPNDQIHITALSPGWRVRLDWYLASCGQGFNAGMIGRDRLHDVAALEALSDVELSDLGLERADIPALVFADLFGVPTPDDAGDA